MYEITKHESNEKVNEESSVDIPAIHTADSATYDEASDSDVQAFQELLQGEGQQPTEEELQKQYDKNFQTISYLFMKGVYGHVEEEIKRKE